MKKIMLAALVGAAALCSSVPASAQAGLEEQLMCAIETMGEAEAEALSRVLGTPDAAATDAEVAPLQQAVTTCAAKHGWSKQDSEIKLQFNFSMLSALGLAEKLTAMNVDAVRFETVLDDQSTDQLQAVLNDPENSQILREAITMLKAEQGGAANPEMAGLLAAYLVHVTEAQMLTMEMMGLAL
jgi:hypothetical protein